MRHMGHWSQNVTHCQLWHEAFSPQVNKYINNNKLTFQKRTANENRHRRPSLQENQVYELNRKVLSERLKQSRDTDE